MKVGCRIFIRNCIFDPSFEALHCVINQITTHYVITIASSRTHLPQFITLQILMTLLFKVQPDDYVMVSSKSCIYITLERVGGIAYFLWFQRFSHKFIVLSPHASVLKFSIFSKPHGKSIIHFLYYFLYLNYKFK